MGNAVPSEELRPHRSGGRQEVVALPDADTAADIVARAFDLAFFIHRNRQTAVRLVANALMKLRSPNLVLVVVEHDMDLIMEVCDTIHVLNVGRLLASGDPARIRANAEVVRVYLGGDDE